MQLAAAEHFEDMVLEVDTIQFGLIVSGSELACFACRYRLIIAVERSLEL